MTWVDPSLSSIDVCTVTAAAQSCNGGAGPYQLVDPLASSGGATPIFFSAEPVVSPGGVVSVLAEIDGVAAGAEPSGYSGVGVVGWSSPAGGGAFASGGQGIDDGGTLLASAVNAGDIPAGGAIALDATHLGVYGNEYPFGGGFTDFTTSAPAPSATPTVDATGDYGNQINADGAQLASIPDPAAPGKYLVVVVGAGSDVSPPGCAAGTSDATGYGVGVGTPAALATSAAWSGSYFAPISCDAADPVLAGGGRRAARSGCSRPRGRASGAAARMVCTSARSSPAAWRSASPCSSPKR